MQSTIRRRKHLPIFMAQDAGHNRVNNNNIVMPIVIDRSTLPPNRLSSMAPTKRKYSSQTSSVMQNVCRRRVSSSTATAVAPEGMFATKRKSSSQSSCATQKVYRRRTGDRVVAPIVPDKVPFPLPAGFKRLRSSTNRLSVTHYEGPVVECTSEDGRMVLRTKSLPYSVAILKHAKIEYYPKSRNIARISYVDSDGKLSDRFELVVTGEDCSARIWEQFVLHHYVKASSEVRCYPAVVEFYEWGQVKSIEHLLQGKRYCSIDTCGNVPMRMCADACGTIRRVDYRDDTVNTLPIVNGTPKPHVLVFLSDGTLSEYYTFYGEHLLSYSATCGGKQITLPCMFRINIGPAKVLEQYLLPIFGREHVFGKQDCYEYGRYLYHNNTTKTCFFQGTPYGPIDAPDRLTANTVMENIAYFGLQQFVGNPARAQYHASVSLRNHTTASVSRDTSQTADSLVDVPTADVQFVRSGRVEG